MKRANNLLSRVADPDNLRLAAWKAAKGKRHSPEVMNWSAQMEKHIPLLREQILRGRVEVGEYRYFTVYEPKERRICAPAFREQVLHHALMNVCHEHFERVQVFDSYASRKGKGTYAALDRAKKYTNQYAWYLKLDIRKFFESISHEALILQLARLFKDVVVVGIFEQIITSYEASPGRGLPFLGYHIFPHHVRLLQKSKQRFIRKMRRIEAGYQSGAWDEAKCQRRALPLLAFAGHADSNQLKKNLLLRLKGLSP
jgi:RNA-directed DNA polymerase